MTLKNAKRILSKPENVEGIDLMTCYRRYEDDTMLGHLEVVIANDGDAHISFWADPDDPYQSKAWPSLRFRMPFSGGGQSPRVRKALLLLALAIKLDNEEIPQDRRTKS